MKNSKLILVQGNDDIPKSLNFLYNFSTPFQAPVARTTRSGIMVIKNQQTNPATAGARERSTAHAVARDRKPGPVVAGERGSAATAGGGPSGAAADTAGQDHKPRGHVPERGLKSGRSAGAQEWSPAN